jgi:hypothetical protein
MARIAPVALLIFSACLVLIIVPLLVRELGVQRHLMRATPDLVRIGPVPIADRSQRALMTGCLEITLDWRAPIRAVTGSDKRLEGCERAARSLLVRTRSLSEASAVLSAISARRGETEAAIRYLHQAREGFPTDLWSALVRVRIAALLPTDPAWSDPALRRDLDLSVSHWRGRPEIARLYLGRTDLRPAVLDAIRRAEPSEAGRMLNLIRSVGG